jgi:pimeloyl-ACP methyl ester carboxylesterase
VTSTLKPDPSLFTLPPYSFFETRWGTGTPVVLIHGCGGSSAWWRHNVDALAAEHLVSAIDLIGVGPNRFVQRRSVLPATFIAIAELVARWIEASFKEPVHLIGNSIGGHIAIHVSATRPDLVRSLVLVDSTGVPFALRPLQHLRNLVVPAGARSVATMLARDLFRSGPASVLHGLARILRDDARPLLRTLTMPVLLVWGAHDPLVPLPYGRAMAELIPGARLVVIPRAGHVPMWENPEAFNTEVLAFLRKSDERGE